jgi:3-dehydroquinate synthase
MRTLLVDGPLAHPIAVGGGLAGEYGPLVASWCGERVPRAALLVIDEAVEGHAQAVEAALRRIALRTASVRLIADERAKTMPAVETIWREALAARIGRGDLLVAVGGGLVGDVAGFAAASYLRGVRLVQLPTTLLAMVDASTGGKTGINLTLPGGGLGKNLAGAFWPPIGVIADVAALSTLPPRQLRSGLAECVKHAILDGEEHLVWLERSLPAILALDPQVTEELVLRSVAVKAGVVGRDPYERSERALLNLGHTFAHAIETIDGADLSHGEAVAIGLVAACRLGVELAGLAPATAERIRSLLVACGLPVRLPPGVAAQGGGSSELLRRIGFDKKAEGGTTRFVVPAGLGRVRHGVEVPEGVVVAALDAIAG